MVIRLETERLGQFLAGQDLPLSHSVESNSWVHTPAYPMGPRVLSSRVKHLGCEANVEIHFHTPKCLPDVVLSYAPRETFTYRQQRSTKRIGKFTFGPSGVSSHMCRWCNEQGLTIQGSPHQQSCVFTILSDLNNIFEQQSQETTVKEPSLINP
jgi:hypothetical protein